VLITHLVAVTKHITVLKVKPKLTFYATTKRLFVYKFVLLNFFFNYQYKHNNAEGVKTEEAAAKNKLRKNDRQRETQRGREEQIQQRLCFNNIIWQHVV